MRRCARCGEEKPTSEFGWKNKDKGWLVSYCKPCVAGHSRAHYQANKAKYRVRNRRLKRQQRANRVNFLTQYFNTHPCVDCGESDPLVLDFDHLGDKSFCIGAEFHYRPWSQVLEEITKCEVVCANCHRRRTATRRGFRRLLVAEGR